MLSTRQVNTLNRKHGFSEIDDPSKKVSIVDTDKTRRRAREWKATDPGIPLDAEYLTKAEVHRLNKVHGFTTAGAGSVLASKSSGAANTSEDSMNTAANRDRARWWIEKRPDVPMDAPYLTKDQLKKLKETHGW